MQFSSPQIVRDTDQLRRLVRGWRGAQTTIALVPIHQPIHEGHQSLIETAKRHAARTIVSVPADIDLAQSTVIGSNDCDLIFAPVDTAISTQLRTAPDDLTDQASLDTRLTSFARLFNQVQPDIAVFGEKDWRQLVAVRQMVRDLAVPIGIVSSAAVRGGDGLALSSRLRDLTPDQRVTAQTLFKVLSATAGLIADGQPVDQVVAASSRFLSESGFDDVHYLTARRAYDLAPLTRFDPKKPARLIGSVQLGRVTLTDNVPITRKTA